MPFGIFQSTNNITQANITQITNITDFTSFYENVNNIAYGGLFMVFIMLTFWTILFIALQRVENKPLQNIIFSGIPVSIISVFLMAIGLLSSRYAFIPMIVILIFAAITWASKER